MWVSVPKLVDALGAVRHTPHRTEEFSGSELGLRGHINQRWAPRPTLSGFGVLPEAHLEHRLVGIQWFIASRFLGAPLGEQGHETGRGPGKEHAPKS